MRIPRIYTQQPLASGATIALEEGPSRHISKVLRMQLGRTLILFNGLGGEYSACITLAGKKVVEVAVVEFSEDNRQSPLKIELAIALSKGDRFDFVLQKATELGVSKIIPLLTDNSNIKLSAERVDNKLNSWQQMLISACEQCQMNIIPELLKPIKFNDWLGQCTSDLKLVLHHRSVQSLKNLEKPQSLTVLIGPEGGLSQAEIELAQKNNFQAVTLGPRVLRTETAPIAALTLAQYLWGDF